MRVSFNHQPETRRDRVLKKKKKSKNVHYINVTLLKITFGFIDKNSKLNDI